MVIQQKKIAFFRFQYAWFSENPTFSLFTVFKKSPIIRNFFLLKKEPTYTKHIDLTPSLDEIKEKFAKNTKYKIRRAATKDKLVIGLETDKQIAVEFFNKFASKKGLPLISLNHLLFHEQHNLIITKAYSPDYDGIIAMHFYISDEKEKKGMLLYSATTTEGLDDSWKRSFTGRVNRYLHFKDLAYFKENGFTTYDFGGYAVDTEDAALLGINRFKDNFGGELVKEYDYFPIWLYWLSRLRG